MTETMVERVARAICRACGQEPDTPVGISTRGDIIMLWHENIAIARAAIEAMREPNDDVWDAAADAACDGAAKSVNSRILRAIKAGKPREVGLAPIEWLRPAWQAIIDEALREPEETKR